jgi:hypothetical protein
MAGCEEIYTRHGRDEAPRVGPRSRRPGRAPVGSS